MFERGRPTLCANWDWLSVPRHRTIKAPRFFFALSEALSAATLAGNLTPPFYNCSMFYNIEQLYYIC
jgi:hypothetical protein